MGVTTVPPTEPQRRQTEPPTAEVAISHKAVRVTIDGIVHAHVDRARMMGFTSWIEGHPGHSYAIEFAMEGGAFILTEYDSRALWESILRQLAEVV